MQNHSPYRRLLVCFLILSQANGQDEAQVKKILEKSSARLSDIAVRSQASAGMRALSSSRRQAALARAASLGIRQDWTGPGGRKHALIRFDGDRPRYLATHNANAAISTGANLLQAAPISLTGSGFTFGLWDEGLAFNAHQELLGRVTPKDSAPLGDHATHVAGTLIASGVKPAAKGMSPAARIDSYDWLDDISELIDRAASYPGELGKLYISNHSYGFISGFEQTGANSWDWYGDGSFGNSIEEDFGRYNDDAEGEDALAYSAPYFLMFRSAGNERQDNPLAGDLITYSSGTTAAYDPARNPKGDGVYRGGFENIEADALAKNLMTVGSVGDAVTGGVRDPSKAAMSDYSSWGPTDDGRIKPDVVANGEQLYSSVSTGTADYKFLSGTSMATPNAAGSSMLLIQLYDRLFPGQAMRASTLKALVIQTCDDLGNPGPDYKFGWGLVNVKAAADLLTDQSQNPGKNRLSENQLNADVPSRTETLTWDGVSPIRATLSWTDPAGKATTLSDSRTPRLVNDLNLHIVGPDGAVYRPFVMPFVGTWTQASMDLPATTGINTTDNTEQVLIQSPPAPGDYQVIIDHAGSLTDGSQTYSLILTDGVSRTMPAPALTSYSPQTVAGGVNDVAFTAAGAGFHTGASVVLSKSGSTPIPVGGLQITGESITGHISTGALSLGAWDLKITNPDGQSITIPGALTADASLWSENFEQGTTGWTHNTSGIGDYWINSTVNPHSATHCFRANGPNIVNLNNLISPLIPIPANATDLTFTFWQACAFSQGDGGLVEISKDNGATWFDIGATGSGTALTGGKYDGKIPSGTGNPAAGRSGWMGTSGIYFQSVISLDRTIWAGKNLKLRWRLAADSKTASPGGWSIDDLSLNGKLVTVSYPAWAAKYFPDFEGFDAQEDGDADGDGLTNFVEYAMGTDPTVRAAQPLTVKNADGSITINFSRAVDTEGITYHAETSSDLINWTDVPITPLGVAADNPLLLNMRAVLPAPSGSGPKFIRLRFAH